jgi:glycosyltransferase involved in cell wall biosynthesis
VTTRGSELSVLLIADEIPPVTSGRASLFDSLVRSQPASGTAVLSVGRAGGPAIDRAWPAAVHRLPVFLARLGGAWARRQHFKFVVSRHEPGLVVAFGTGREATLARELKRTMGTPFLLHLEAPALTRVRRTLREGGHRAASIQSLLDEADGVVAATEVCRLEAYRCGVLPQHLDIVPPGVDLESFRPGPRPDALARSLKAERGPVLLTVTGPGPAKDLDTVFRAFSVVRGQRRNAVLIVAGTDGGPHRRALRHLKVDRHVRFLASTAPSEMPELYRLADLYVTAHREDPASWIVAGVEMAIVEALACGCPVLGTRTPIVEELAPSEEVGMLVEPTAHAKLGRALLDALRSKESRDRWGAEARARAERLYSARENAAAFRELTEVVYFRRLGLGRLEPALAPEERPAA